MPSAYEVYTFYLDPEDLAQPVQVTIETIHREDIFNPRAKKNEPRLIARFQKARKVLPLNKTQVAALIEITGTDDYSQWGGAMVKLSADRASNGKPTIKIEKI